MWQDNVFTPVCPVILFTKGGGGSGRHTTWADTPWAYTPRADNPQADTHPGKTPLLPADTPPTSQTATTADGTHPTEMLSCIIYNKNFYVIAKMFTLRLIYTDFEMTLTEIMKLNCFLLNLFPKTLVIKLHVNIGDLSFLSQNVFLTQSFNYKL